MLKTRALVLSFVVLMLFAFANSAFAAGYAEAPNGFEWYSFFDDEPNHTELDGACDSSWSNAHIFPSGVQWVQTPVGSSYDPGDNVMVMVTNGVGAKANGYINCAFQNIPLENIDYRKLSLQFYIAPLLESSNYEIGLTCWGLDTPTGTNFVDGYSVQKISLTDYIGLSDKNFGKWTLVTIPLSYIIEHGTFDSANDTQMTAFDPARINGLYFGASAENVLDHTYGMTHIALYDKIRFIYTLNAPQNILMGANGSSVTLDWSEAKGMMVPNADRYKVYKQENEFLKVQDKTTDGVKLESYLVESGTGITEIADLTNGQSAYTDATSENDLFSAYFVQAANTGLGAVSLPAYVSSPLQSIFSTLGKSVGTQMLSTDVYYYNKDGKTIVSWGKDASAPDSYIVKNNGQFVAATQNRYYEFTDQLSGTITVSGYYASTDLYSQPKTAQNHAIVQMVNPTAIRYYSNGTEISGYGAADRLDSCNVTVYNYTGETKKVDMVLTVYKDGSLQQVYHEPYTISHGYNEVELTPGFVTVVPGSYEVKVLIWSDMQNVTPAGNTLTIIAGINNALSYNAAVLPQTYQTVRGLGTSSEFIGDYNAYDWQELADALYKDLGMTMTRFFIPKAACNDDASINTSVFDQHIIEGIQYIQSNGLESYMLTYQETPASWQYLEYPDFPDTTPYRVYEDKNDDIVSFLISCLDRISANNLPLPEGISFANEPGWRTKYPGAQYAAIAKLLKSAMVSAGYGDVKLVGFESAAYWQLLQNYVSPPAYADIWSPMLTDSAFANAIDVIGVHSYTQSSSISDNNLMNYFVTEASKFPAKERWQTEYCVLESMDDFDNYHNKSLLREMKIFAADMAWGGHTVWLHWASYLTQMGELSYPGQSKDKVSIHLAQVPSPQNASLIYGMLGNDTIVKSNIFYGLSTIFKNVPKGAVVKRMSTNCGTVTNLSRPMTDMVAFDCGDYTVTLLVNDSDNDYLFNYSGLEGSTATAYTVFETCDGVYTIGNFSVSNGAVSGVFTPANSVNVIVTK